jgi:hypothetical protein
MPKEFKTQFDKKGWRHLPKVFWICFARISLWRMEMGKHRSKFFVFGVLTSNDRKPRSGNARDVKALDEDGRSKATFQLLAEIRSFSDEDRAAFHAIWTVRGHRIRREIGDDFLLLDALWRVLPAYAGESVHLYRGEAWSDFSIRRHGMSWSIDIDIARMFARGRNALAPGGGVLIESMVPADAIISGPPGGQGVAAEEFEYVVDRRKLTEMRELAKFPPI